MAFDDGIRLFLKDFLNEGGEILIMIIKGIAVDAAFLDDIADGDLLERPLIQQPDKGFLDRRFCKIGHECHSFQ